jgi:hypothetical protein
MANDYDWQSSTLATIASVPKRLDRAKGDLAELRLATAVARLEDVLSDVKAAQRFFPRDFDGTNGWDNSKRW